LKSKGIDGESLHVVRGKFVPFTKVLLGPLEKEEVVRALVEETIQKFGRIDIVVT
jgi:NAD(P)-dependent dehydrogenase (short-subunit alcohol dehydrogenase family)